MRPPSDVLAARMTAQGLTGPPATSGADAVRRLGCVQSQEHAHALWSLGLRSAGPSAADLAARFDAGDFLRTHVLRPTWHLVAPEDLRWIQATTAPRVHQTNGPAYRRAGFTPADLACGDRVIVGAVEQAQAPLTRSELAAALTAAGLPAAGLPLVLLVMHAELEALICSGAMRGNQHTYALVAHRVPVDAPREPDLPELARRFVTGHGPAGVQDLCRWASLTRTQAGAAFATLGDRLASVEVEGTRLWYDPAAAEPCPVPSTDVLLLPLYDELPLSYRELGVPAVPDHPHPPGTDQAAGTVVAQGRNVGRWRRVVKRTTVEVDLTLAPSTSAALRAGAARSAAVLADFLGLQLVLDVPGPRSGICDP